MYLTAPKSWQKKLQNAYYTRTLKLSAESDELSSATFLTACAQNNFFSILNVGLIFHMAALCN